MGKVAEERLNLGNSTAPRRPGLSDQPHHRLLQVSDELWEALAPLLPKRIPIPWAEAAPGRTGPAPTASSTCFAPVASGQVPGCHRHLLRLHRRFQEWAAAGVFLELWRTGLERYDDLKGLDWSWLSMDGALTKSPLGGGKNRSQPHRPG